MGGGKKVLLLRLNRNIITYVYSIIACLLPFHENVGGKIENRKVYYNKKHLLHFPQKRYGRAEKLPICSTVHIDGILVSLPLALHCISIMLYE